MQTDFFYTLKYAPRCLEDIEHNHPNTQKLKRLSQFTNTPHLLFVGPEGSGKMTMVRCFIAAVRSSPEVFRLQKHIYEKEYVVRKSKYHIELDVDMFKSKTIMYDIIKEHIHTIDVSLNSHIYVVLRHARRISPRMQSMLKVFLDKYTHTSRFIVVTRHAQFMQSYFRSRFLRFSVLAPTDKEMASIVKNIQIKEHLKGEDTLRTQYPGDITTTLLHLQLQGVNEDVAKLTFSPVNTLAQAILKTRKMDDDIQKLCLSLVVMPQDVECIIKECCLLLISNRALCCEQQVSLVRTATKYYAMCHNISNKIYVLYVCIRCFIKIVH